MVILPSGLQAREADSLIGENMTMTATLRRGLVGAIAILLLAGQAWAQEEQQEERPETTPRRADEGDGPYDRLILRGVTVIDGTGAPPQGPVDIVIEGDRIVSIESVGFPGLPIDEDERPSLEDEDNPSASVHEMSPRWSSSS